MRASSNEEHWRRILELSETVAELPVHERLAYLASENASDEVIAEVLELAEEFHEQPGAETISATRAGTRIDRFLITRLLGRGGMGEVYAAHDTELDRDVALKFLSEQTLDPDRGVHKFIREAQTASTLNHPNIVTIHEIVRSGSTLAIVMELVEGTSLRKACLSAPSSTVRVFEIGEQIALALAAAHSRGIVHRDIKPENVLLTPEGRVKVLDFGLARQTAFTSSGSSLNSPAGTLRYLSPEQTAGESATSASDIFSLGIVLHELATGRHPFPGDSPIETAHAILTGGRLRLDSNSPFPAEFWALLEAMLDKRPVHRPTSGDVARRLAEMRAGSAAESQVGARPRRRHFSAAAILALFLTVAGVSWAIWWRTNWPENANLRIRPLTSQPGWEESPALSPDGQNIVFGWSEALDRTQLYLKPVAQGEPVRLTDFDDGTVGAPVWSPDGTKLAFKRQWTVVGALFTMPAKGGPFSRVVELANANVSSEIDWSPDGNQLAFSDQLPGTFQLALYVYDLRTGEKRKLTTPPDGIWGDWSPKFSPDGKTVAFKRVNGFWSDNMFLVPSAGGPAHQLTSMGTGIWGHAWTSDGKNLLVSCQRASSVFGIWRFSISNPSHPELVHQGSADSIRPGTARNSNRITWVDQVWNLNLYRASVSGSEPPVRLVSSTRRDQAPAYGPHERFAFVSDRSGSREVWIARTDGSGQTKATDFRGPQIDHLGWSPDGRFLVFDSRPRGRSEVFTLACEPVELQCDKPKVLESSVEAPSWSADGTAVYYASNRSGSWQIYRQPIAGGTATPMMAADGYFSRESNDGQWLYYSKPAESEILRIRLVGGRPAGRPAEVIVGPPYRPRAGGWALAPEEVLFIEEPARYKPTLVRAVSLKSRQVRVVRDLGTDYANRVDISISVSPDGKWMLYPRLDASGANIMIAEAAR